MKFMLMVLELNAANSKYACMWCEVPNSKQWDMSVSKDQYTGSNMHTLDKMRRCGIQERMCAPISEWNQTTAWLMSYTYSYVSQTFYLTIHLLGFIRYI